MTISFQFWSMHFFVAKGGPVSDNMNSSSTQSCNGVQLLDDSDLDACFKVLLEGNNVAVRLENGMRRLMNYLKKKYEYVHAAGGVVENGNGERLMIVRNDRADLPKGKVEQGETLAEAALREVSEETGLTALTLGPLLTKTYHIYNLYGGWHLKQTSWFLMHATENQQFAPQHEEGITACEWLPKEEWQHRLSESYATMRQVRSL